MGQPTVFRLCSGRPHRSLGSCQYGVKQEEKRHCENMVSLELHREDSLYYTESECGTILRAPAGSPPLRPQKCASPLVSALEAESPQKIESHCSNSVLTIETKRWFSVCVCLLCFVFGLFCVCFFFVLFCFALFHFLNPDLCEQNIFMKYCLSPHDKKPSQALGQ